MHIDIDLTKAHRRRDPLTGRWVLMAPRDLDALSVSARIANPVVLEQGHADWCYFCAGNENNLNQVILNQHTPFGPVIVTTKKNSTSW